MPFFGQERLVISEATTSLDAPEYRKAVAAIQQATRADGIDALMDRHTLDAIVAPTTGPAWLTDHIRGDRFDGGDSAGTAAIAGYPDISVPMGLVSGLPVGLSFFGRAWSEPTLIRIAYAYEQATKRRQPPTLRGDARVDRFAGQPKTRVARGLQRRRPPSHALAQKVRPARRRQRLPAAHAIDQLTTIFASQSGEADAAAWTLLHGRSPERRARHGRGGGQRRACS